MSHLSASICAFASFRSDSFRTTGHILPFGTAREEARSRPERGHDHQQYHYKHRIIEHTFDGITSSGNTSIHASTFIRKTDRMPHNRALC